MVVRTIGDVSGQDIPSFDADLGSIGYDDAMCTKLAAELDNMADTFLPGTHVDASQINTTLTVQDVIDLMVMLIGTTGVKPGGQAD